MKYLRRPLPTVAWQDNTPLPVSIPREHYLKRLKVHAEITLNQTGAGTALQDAPFSAFQRVDLIANGKDTLRSLTGIQLLEYNKWFYGVDPTKGAGYSLAVNTGNNRVSFDVMVDTTPAMAELLAVLPTFRLSSLQLVIVTGSGGTLSSAGTPVITAASSNVYVETDEIIRDAESDAYLAPLTEYVTFQSQLQKAPTGTGNLDIDLPVGADYLDILTIYRTGASAAAVTNGGRSDAMVREVVLLGDSIKVLADQYAEVQAASGTFNSGGSMDSEMLFDGGFQVARDAGVYMVDFLKGGDGGSKRLTELDGRHWRALPVRSAEFATMTHRSIVQAVLANNNVEVVPMRVFRLR